MLLDIPGTTFTSLSTNSSQKVKASIILNYSLLFTPDIHLAEAADQLLELYSGIPSLGSPFSTGDDTFGLDSEFKRLAAISALTFLLASPPIRLRHWRHGWMFMLTIPAAEDLWFQSQRRAWSQRASQAASKRSHTCSPIQPLRRFRRT
ncbi:hypothetical protein C8J57DRAFT_1511627 [Mycena rebaudengoi]|nr:hypothetical protein C8J57DRAFT_1511627 [Mycena rebaudengoi]